MTLYECKPMNARISQVQCKKNRTMQDNPQLGIMKDFRCKGCPGLGEPTKIDVEVITIMAKKHCSENGCFTVSWKSGFCWKHHPDHVANKKAACADKQTVRDIHKAAEVAETVCVQIIEPLPKVTAHEFHIVNLIDAFKQKQAAEYDLFISKLSDIKDHIEKLQFAAKEILI